MQNLEGMLAQTQARLDIATGATETSVYQRLGYMDSDKKVFLNPSYEVVFVQGENHRSLDVRQASGNDAKYYGPHIRVMGTMGALKISPECTNVIRIALEKL